MRICLPSIFDKAQLKAVVSILNEKVPSEIEKGIQLIQSGHSNTLNTKDDFTKYNSLIDQCVPEDHHIELHAPICPHDPKKYLNLSNSESVGTLLHNAKIAESIGASVMIVHPNTVYFTEQKQGTKPSWAVWKREYNDFQTMKTQIRDKMYKHLIDLARLTPIDIGVENMPIPINADIQAEPSNILYEPNMVTYEDFMEFCNLTSPISNLKIVYDTSHALHAKGILDRLREYGIKTTQGLLSTPFRGIYLEQISVQPEIDFALKEIHGRGKLAGVQLAGAGKLWRPYVPLEEGASLERNNFPFLLNIVNYLKDQLENITISLDINETDYLGRPNQKRALEVLIKNLS